MLDCHALTERVHKPLGDLQNCKCQIKLLRTQVTPSPQSQFRVILECESELK